MRLPKLPLKQINETISELEAVLFEGENNEYENLRVRDATEILYMLQCLKEKDAFSLELMWVLDKHVVLEYLDEKIVNYMEAWLHNVTKEIVAEYKKKELEGGADDAK